MAGAVRERVGEFQRAGIAGVDLFLAGVRPGARSVLPPLAAAARRAARPARDPVDDAPPPLFDEPWDPYAVTPGRCARRRPPRGQALAAGAVDPRLKANADRRFRPPPSSCSRGTPSGRRCSTYDEALRLARAVGLDLDRELTGRLAHKSGGNLTVWGQHAPGGQRRARASRRLAAGMIDALHHAAHTAARTRSLTAARELLERTGADRDPRFFTALEAVLEVLPLSQDVTGVPLTRRRTGCRRRLRCPLQAVSPRLQRAGRRAQSAHPLA